MESTWWTITTHLMSWKVRNSKILEPLIIFGGIPLRMQGHPLGPTSQRSTTSPNNVHLDIKSLKHEFWKTLTFQATHILTVELKTELPVGVQGYRTEASAPISSHLGWSLSNEPENLPVSLGFLFAQEGHKNGHCMFPTWTWMSNGSVALNLSFACGSFSIILTFLWL